MHIGNIIEVGVREIPVWVPPPPAPQPPAEPAPARREEEEEVPA